MTECTLLSESVCCIAEVCYTCCTIADPAISNAEQWDALRPIYHSTDCILKVISYMSSLTQIQL